MPAVLGRVTRQKSANSPAADVRRASVLHGQLRAVGRNVPGADTAVATCLVWVADTLVEIASALRDPRSADVPVDEAAAQHLTEREHSVLVRLQEDVPLRQIGLDLFISHNTVKTHARAVYRKLGVSSRTQALDRARQLGLL